MATFQALPNEMLCEIISLVLTADLENLAQTCRKIASAAQPYLKEHRELCRNYNSCDIRVCPGSGTGNSSIRTLAEDVSTDTRIGHYVLHLDTSVDYALDAVDVDDEDAQPKFFPSLLTRLPNLCFLAMDEPHDVLVDLMRLFESPESMHTALPKLRHFELRSSGYPGIPLALAQAFSALPSMKELSLMNTDDVGDEGLIKPVESNVTELALGHCHIRAEELHEFLQGFTKLEEFSYSGNRGGTDPNSHAFAIPSGLHSCKDHIRTLRWVAPGKPKCYMGSLEGFEHLEELETEYSFLKLSQESDFPLPFHLPMSLRSLRIRCEEDAFREEQSEFIAQVAAWKKEHKSQLHGLVLMCGGTERVVGLERGVGDVGT